MSIGSNRKKTLLNLISSLSGQVVTIAIGLIVPRLYLVSYGSETNGLLNSVNQFLVYLGLFESGVGLATLQELYKPVAIQDKVAINKVLSSTHRYYRKAGKYYFFALILLAALYPLLAKSSLNYHEVALIVIISGIGSGSAFFVHGKYKLLLQAEGKNYIISNIGSIYNIAAGVIKVVMVNRKMPITAIVFASTSLNLLQGTFFWAYIRKNYTWIDVKMPVNTYKASQKRYVLIHQIAGLVFQNTDILILTITCNLSVVSVYSVYKLVYVHLESLLLGCSSSVNYRLGQLFQIDKRDYIRKIMIFELVFGALSFSIYAVAFDMILPFVRLYTSGVADIQYEDGLIAILFTTIALLTIIRQPMLMTINYAGHFKNTTRQTIAETLINLVVSLFGVWICGIYGVLLGTVAALAYRSIDVLFYANKKLLDQTPWKSLKIYLIDIVTFIGTQVIFNIIAVDYKVQSFMTFVVVCIAELLVALMVFSVVLFAGFSELRQFCRKEYNKEENQ